MTREEAYKAMQEGHKVAHRYFGSDEYYYIKDEYGHILGEDNVPHTSVFWRTDGNDWRRDGWFIKE